jgi:hypothetical protein
MRRVSAHDLYPQSTAPRPQASVRSCVDSAGFSIGKPKIANKEASDKTSCVSEEEIVMNAHPVEAAQAALTQPSMTFGGRYSDERWSIGLALVATVLIPTYFFLVPLYSPQYVPIRPWVWAVPGMVCILYLFAQFWALMQSAGCSDDIGMKDIVVSLLAALSSFGTLVGIVILWTEDRLYFGPFQAMAVITITLTTFGELIFTAWVRYLVNRRYFSSVGPAHQ